MRAFVLFAVVAVALARPEPPSGYNYNRPSAGGAVASGGYSGASQGGGYTNGGYSSGGGSGFGVSGGGHSFGGGNGGHSGHGASFGGNGGGASFGGNGGGFSSGGSSGGFSGGNGGFSSGGGAGFGGGQPATIVQKHIYVHVPPPEEEAAVAQQQQQLAAPRKHYKIIFIKAPSAPSITQQIAAAQAQNEEKTLIYVLVKKPEDIVSGPGPAPVASLPVSKPEVYFIKYKTQKDAAGAIGGVSFGGGAAAGFGGSAGGASSSGASFGSGVSGGATDFQVSNPASSYGAPFKK